MVAKSRLIGGLPESSSRDSVESAGTGIGNTSGGCGFPCPIRFASALDSPRHHQPAIVLTALKDKPFGWPRKTRPSLTAARHDGACKLWSRRKNGSAGVKQKNDAFSKIHAKNLRSRYVRATLDFRDRKSVV